MITQ
jgi:hypothetical protein